MVARSLIIDHPKQLHRALDVLSDECRFDPDEDIVYDEAASKLLVKLVRARLDKRELIGRVGLRREWNVPLDEVLLYVHGARDYFTEDSGGQGVYDFGEISYDSDKGVVNLVADDKSAFKLSVIVDRLKLELLETGVIVGTSKRKSIS